MNHLIADNKVATLRNYLTDKLQACYDAREAGNIVIALFEAFNGWSRTDVVMHAHRRMGESELLTYHFALKRLLTGEPLQYVLGYTWFHNMKLFVDKQVLIPRPETEELVRFIVSRNELNRPRILDVGTGSGCIAIALKKLIPQAHVVAMDVSVEALAVARKNAAAQHVDITFEQLDVLSAIPAGTYDIVVSNPPYIPESELESMSKLVTDHEPHLALFTGDDDALLFYRRLMALSAHILDENGCAYCEIHEDKAEELLTLASQYSTIHSPEIRRDMQGKNRIIAWKNRF